MILAIIACYQMKSREYKKQIKKKFNTRHYLNMKKKFMKEQRELQVYYKIKALKKYNLSSIKMFNTIIYNI